MKKYMFNEKIYVKYMFNSLQRKKVRCNEKYIRCNEKKFVAGIETVEPLETVANTFDSEPKPLATVSIRHVTMCGGVLPSTASTHSKVKLNASVFPLIGLPGFSDVWSVSNICRESQ